MRSMLALVFVSAVAAATPIGTVTDIVVTRTGIGPRKDGCAAFKPTPAQVRAFLDKAVLLSGAQQHDFFLHGPCSARGTVETRYDTWRFELRNLGTATVTATNGDVFVLGDPARESSLEDDAGR